MVEDPAISARIIFLLSVQWTLHSGKSSQVDALKPIATRRRRRQRPTTKGHNPSSMHDFIRYPPPYKKPPPPRPLLVKYTPLSTMAAEKESAVAPYNAEEDPVKRLPDQRERRRRLLRRSAYAFVAALALATIILVPVGLTLYKVHNPKMTMKSVDFVWENLPPGIFLRVLATGSVKNTNRVTFYFKKSLTTVFWSGKRLANATGPGGATGAGKSYELSLALDVSTENDVNLLNLFSDLKKSSNVLNFDTSTTVDGHVKVFGIFRHRVDVFIDCSLSVDFHKERIISQSCKESVKV